MRFINIVLGFSIKKMNKKQVGNCYSFQGNMCILSSQNLHICSIETRLKVLVKYLIVAALSVIDLLIISDYNDVNNSHTFICTHASLPTKKGLMVILIPSDL